jgi:putative transposase
MFLAAASRLLSRASRPSFFIRPDTLLGWHRQLVRKRWTYAGQAPGRPAVAEEIRALVLRLARENPRWGYQRIVGEVAGVGQQVSATTVAKILREADMSPAGARAQLRWHEFLRVHAVSIIACDFFTVETLWLGRLYVLFFIELGTRRVQLVGCSANPDGLWTTQQARRLAWSLAERPSPIRFLIHDRDSKFSRAFDEVFKSEAIDLDSSLRNLEGCARRTSSSPDALIVTELGDDGLKELLGAHSRVASRRTPSSIDSSAALENASRR